MTKPTQIDRMMDSITPQTLAKLTTYISHLIGPDTDPLEFKALQDLSNAAFDAGQRNCGMDFVVMFFDQEAEVNA